MIFTTEYKANTVYLYLLKKLTNLGIALSSWLVAGSLTLKITLFIKARTEKSISPFFFSFFFFERIDS